MANHRRDRINEEMTKEMSEIVRRIKDPRVSSSLVTITGCDVTADLKYAKVFYSFLDAVKPEDMEEKRKEIKNGLKSAVGFIRRELAASLNLRVTPELTFVPDTSIEYGANITRILHEIEENK